MHAYMYWEPAVLSLWAYLVVLVFIPSILVLQCVCYQGGEVQLNVTNLIHLLLSASQSCVVHLSIANAVHFAAATGAFGAGRCVCPRPLCACLRPRLRLGFPDVGPSPCLRRGLRSPRPLRHSPLMGGLQHPSRPGSRCQSPARLTPAPSPLPRRPRRYQNRLDVTAAAMARSRSMDAILDSGRRPRRPPERGESEGSAAGSPPRSREGTPPSGTDGLSSEDGLDELDLPPMNGRSSEESESEEGRRLPRHVPQEEPSARRSASAASCEDAPRADRPGGLTSEQTTPPPVEALGPAAKSANGRLRLSVPPQESAAPGREERLSQPRTLPRSARLGRSRQPPKVTLSAPSPDSPKSLPCSSSPSLSVGSERAPSGGSRGSRPSDIFRQNRLRKSNLVERAFTKVRSKITKENK